MAVASEVTEPVVLIQTDDHSGPLGGSGDLLRVSGDAVVSCLKLAESAEGIVVRLFNPAKEEVVAGIALGSQLNARIAGARAVDLLEREVESETVEVTADRVNVRLAGHAIETVRILLR
jgi:alpha-mannosidase